MPRFYLLLRSILSSKNSMACHESSIVGRIFKPLNLGLRGLVKFITGIRGLFFWSISFRFCKYSSTSCNNSTIEPAVIFCLVVNGIPLSQDSYHSSSSSATVILRISYRISLMICENINTHSTRAIEIQNGSRPQSCPDGVVAYHEALSRLRPGFKSRSGRH